MPERLSANSVPDIVGMRNRLVHAYFDINLNIVWTTVTEELPTLRMQVELILGADAGSA